MALPTGSADWLTQPGADLTLFQAAAVLFLRQMRLFFETAGVKKEDEEEEELVQFSWGQLSVRPETSRFVRNRSFAPAGNLFPKQKKHFAHLVFTALVKKKKGFSF